MAFQFWFGDVSGITDFVWIEIVLHVSCAKEYVVNYRCCELLSPCVQWEMLGKLTLVLAPHAIGRCEIVYPSQESEHLRGQQGGVDAELMG